jgi:SAM-dependent methyltransferase
VGRGTRYPFVENILREYNKSRESRVLEIGAGGAVYRHLFFNYIGTDLVDNPYAAPGDLAVYCDACQIPFKAGTFDLVFVVAALYQIPNTTSVFEEVYRVLKSGSVFLIIDYNKKMTKKLKSSERDGVNRNQIWSPRDLKALLDTHGFRAKVLNHYLYFPAQGNALRQRIKHSSLYHWARDCLFKDWNVILAEK